MKLEEILNRNKNNEKEIALHNELLLDEGVMQEVNIEDKSNSKINLKSIAITAMLVIFIISGIGGYSVYNNTNFKYDSAEMIENLKDMQNNLDSLSDVVNSNEYILTELDLSHAEEEGYAGGIVSNLNTISDDIGSTQKEISSLITSLENNDSASKEEYESMTKKYTSIHNNMTEINKNMNSTLESIGYSIEKLEKEGKIENEEVLTSLKTVQGNLDTINMQFQAKTEEQLVSFEEKINNLNAKIEKIAEHNEEQMKSISNYNEDQFKDLISHNDEQLKNLSDYNEEQFENLTNHNDEQLKNISNRNEEQFENLTNHNDEQFKNISNRSDDQFENLNNIINDNNNDIKKQLMESQQSLSDNQVSFVNQMNNMNDNINSTLASNQKDAMNMINDFNSKINNTISDNQASIAKNMDAINMSISGNQTEITKTIATNHESLLLLIDDTRNDLEQTIKDECMKVFQQVTNGKYMLVSALVTKYDMMSASWSVNGQNVEDIINEAKNSASNDEERNSYVSNKISYSDIQEAINNIPTEINIKSGDSYIPAEIKYQHHYHTNQSGNIVNAETSSTNIGGCFTVANIHRHNSNCYVPPITCDGMMTHRDNNSSSTHRCTINEKHAWSGNCNSWGIDWKQDEHPCLLEPWRCGYVLKEGYYKCGYSDGQLINYTPSCGLINGQIVSAEIVWEKSTTGKNE